jgi:hypothetical protein
MADTTEKTVEPSTPQAMAQALQEPNVALLSRVVKVLGPERATAFLAHALALEADGGMLTEDKRRRRTPGGVFFYLVRQGVDRKERYRIFGGGPQGTTQAPLPAMGTWEELIEAIRTFPAATGEEASVKITLIGRPATPVQTQGQTVVFQMTGKAPNNLPKGLPPLPKSPPITWTVMVGLRQWNKVKDSLAQHPDDKLIIDGYPYVEGDQHLVFVNGCRSMLMEKAQKEAQRAVAGERSSRRPLS